MRRFRHWTPRYLSDRIRWWMYEKRNPEKPWITPTANALLATLIQPTDRGLEWGSGRSTPWFAARMQRLTSVESNPEWFERVRASLQRQGVRNVDYRMEGLQPQGDPARSPYVSVVNDFEDRSLGFVLVDGEYREHCALAVLPKLSPGGILAIDNCNWYLDRPTTSPSSRTGLGPLNSDWQEFERRVAAWRCIWTTSGVSDTALWIKPAA